MGDTSVYFRAEKNIKRQFDIAVAGTDFNNKRIFNAFLEKFVSVPAETLQFIGLEPEN